MQRVQCSVMVDGVRCYVIAEQNAEGGLDFFMQEPGEVRWYGFKPTSAEQEAARRLLANGAAHGWPLLGQPAIARK